ncbi:hypothetical protein BDR07DRAFT_34104 [Suillus spraguei]|nr:hypothetical protein BDR07DRAFT_34104 [Suillus spraguei]
MLFLYTSAVVRHIQPRDPLDFSATSPLSYSLSGQVATQFDHLEISSPPSRSNGVVQSLRQHLSFLVPRHSHEPPVTEVAPNRRDARLLAAIYRNTGKQTTLDIPLANRLPCPRNTTQLTLIHSRRALVQGIPVLLFLLVSWQTEDASSMALGAR